MNSTLAAWICSLFKNLLLCRRNGNWVGCIHNTLAASLTLWLMLQNWRFWLRLQFLWLRLQPWRQRHSPQSETYLPISNEQCSALELNVYFFVWTSMATKAICEKVSNFEHPGLAPARCASTGLVEVLKKIQSHSRKTRNRCSLMFDVFWNFHKFCYPRVAGSSNTIGSILAPSVPEI